METIGTRLRLMRKQLNMTQEQLAQRLGVGKAALSMIETGKAGLSNRNKNILVQDFNVNAEWLDSGTGKMFNAEPNLTAYSHRTDKSLPLQSVPLYSMEGTAGLVPLFSNEANIEPINHIHIPNLPKCDGAIYVVGDSRVAISFYISSLTMCAMYSGAICTYSLSTWMARSISL